MNIYFIRHGQSTFLDKSIVAEKKHQFADTPLSEFGQKQVADLAQKLSDTSIDLILTSPYTRALQTAQAIEKVKQVSVTQSDLLIERKMPSIFLGKPTDDPEIVPIHNEIRQHFYEPDWHYADEENFTDLFLRAQAACHFILAQQKENIAVVTHGYFLTVIIFYIIFSDKTDTKLFKPFREHTINTTASLTQCKYENGDWKLITWNNQK